MRVEALQSLAQLAITHPEAAQEWWSILEECACQATSDIDAAVRLHGIKVSIGELYRPCYYPQKTASSCAFHHSYDESISLSPHTLFGSCWRNLGGLSLATVPSRLLCDETHLYFSP